jgi:hypothetical protein
MVAPRGSVQKVNFTAKLGLKRIADALAQDGRGHNQWH